MYIKRQTSFNDANEENGEIIFEMVIFDALAQIHKLTGYNKEQMLLALIRIAQEWLTENIIFH